jgi:hypothetical protein
MFWEVPHRAEAATKPIMPAIRNGLRPNMSPSFPATGTSAVDVTRYAVVTQAYRSRPWSSVTIRGIATPTTVWSRAARSSASATPSVARTTPVLDELSDISTSRCVVCITGSKLLAIAAGFLPQYD